VKARRLAVLIAILPLAACDGSAGSAGPGAVSEGEAQALDEAAEMLEQKRLPEGVVPEPDIRRVDRAQDQEEATSE
jgi:hypothetical protein